jgi:protein-S-isoprenylcysteine O-methyltransferase Ste14
MVDVLLSHLPACAVLVAFLERMREVFTRRDVVAGAKKESLTFRLFMFCGVAIVAGGLAEYYLRGLSLWWPTFLLGLGFSILSFVIRRTAIRALGRFWSLHVEMREGHEFVKTGPFAYVRHPVYSSMVLEILGIGLMLNAWFTLAAVLLVFVPTMLARIRIEEEALITQFGDGYRDYMRSTPALIPAPWRRKEQA